MVRRFGDLRLAETVVIRHGAWLLVDGQAAAHVGGGAIEGRIAAGTPPPRLASNGGP